MMEKSNLHHCLKESDYVTCFVDLTPLRVQQNKSQFFPESMPQNPQGDHTLEALPTECPNPRLTFS